MSEEKKSGLAAAAAKLKAAKAKKKTADASAENSKSVKNDAADNPNLVSGIINAVRRFKRDD